MQTNLIIPKMKITEIMRDNGLNNIIAFRECLNDQSITEEDEEESGYSDIVTVRKLQAALRQYFKAKHVMDARPAQILYPHELEAKLKDLFDLMRREVNLYRSIYKNVYKTARFLSEKLGLDLKRIVDIDYSPDFKEFCEKQWQKDSQSIKDS